jgi:hypothetical protein
MVISGHGEMTTMNGFCFQYGHAIEVALIQVEIIFCMLEFCGISPKNYITHTFEKLINKNMWMKLSALFLCLIILLGANNSCHAYFGDIVIHIN